MSYERTAGFNKLALGLFAFNVSSGRVVSKLPNRWQGTWADNLELAHMADEAGMDFLLPIGRWKGYPGGTNYQNYGYETLTWACGMLASTKRIGVFATVHAPMIHPVVAAKQMVTADHIGQGRFGLNLVCGWNEDEFQMFGADLRDHDARYRFAQEWLDIVRRIWRETEPFDVEGEFFNLRGVTGRPGPFGDVEPMIMNAGASPAGRAFALANCDLFFTGVSPEMTSEGVIGLVNAASDTAAKAGRKVRVCALASIVCRETEAEAKEFFEYTRFETADWETIDNTLRVRKMIRPDMPAEELNKVRRYQAAGIGTLPIVGNPDQVAAELAKLSVLGFGGLGIDFFHYTEEFPYFRDEVLPRLARAGVRTK